MAKMYTYFKCCVWCIYCHISNTEKGDDQLYLFLLIGTDEVFLVVEMTAISTDSFGYARKRFLLRLLLVQVALRAV